MTLSGFVGSLSGIPIHYYNTPFGYMYENRLWIHVLFAMMAGLFTTLGQFSYFAAVNLGSVEVAQLFINMKPIVQLVEEAMFLWIFPTLWASVGILIAIIGASFVIFGKRETEHQHADEDKEQEAIMNKHNR